MGQVKNKNTKTATTTTPLVTSINSGNQQLRCAFRDCQQVAQTKCEGCAKLVCLNHHDKVRQGYGHTYSYCPDCASNKRRLMIGIAVAVLGSIVVAIVVLVYMHLTNRL
jgi:hypothetical protein